MDAGGALAHLTEISSQVDAAVIADTEGVVLASTLDDDERAQRMARAALSLLAAAEHVRGDRPAELAQLDATMPDGSVFVVRDADRVIAATTPPEPTVGLVFYDLKMCLRDAGAPREAEADARS